MVLEILVVVVVVVGPGTEIIEVNLRLKAESEADTKEDSKKAKQLKSFIMDCEERSELQLSGSEKCEGKLTKAVKSSVRTLNLVVSALRIIQHKH